MTSQLRRFSKRVSSLGPSPSKRVVKTLEDLLEQLTKQLGSSGQVLQSHAHVFELLVDLSKLKFKDENLALQLFEKGLYYFDRIPQRTIANDVDVFKTTSSKFLLTIEQIDTKFLRKTNMARMVMDHLLEVSFANNAELLPLWLDMLQPLLASCTSDTVYACYKIVDRQCVKFRLHKPVVHRLLDTTKARLLDCQSEEKEDADCKRELADFAVHLIYHTINEGLAKEFSMKFLHLAIDFLERREKDLFSVMQTAASNAEPKTKDHKAAAVSIMGRLHALLKDAEYPWYEHVDILPGATCLVRALIRPVNDAKTFSLKEHEFLLDMCRTCVCQDPIHPTTGTPSSVFFNVLFEIYDNQSEWLKSINRLDIAADLIPGFLRYFESGDERLDMLSCKFLNDFAQVSSGLPVVAPYLGDIIKLYFTKGDVDLLRVIHDVYQTNPEPMTDYFHQFLLHLQKKGNGEVLTWIVQIIWKVSKTQPQLFRPEDITMLLTRGKTDSRNRPSLVSICQELCRSRASDMADHLDLIVSAARWDSNLTCLFVEMLANIGYHCGKAAPRVVGHVTQMALSPNKNIALMALYYLSVLARKHPRLVASRREALSKLNNPNPDVQMSKSHLMQVIDGNTPKALLKKLVEEEKKLTSMTERVTAAEDDSRDLKQRQSQQSEDLGAVKDKAGKQGQRLEAAEKAAHDVAIKVEEIDSKTISHAPFWVKDVSLLLNKECSEDWRLLSSRLGYSKQDVKSWAQLADPSTAMLNKWYSDHKTSEATTALLAQLQEMAREDAAVIVENAMKNAEAVVESEDFEYTSPPHIFVSYQWAHQAEVKQIVQHLEMAGHTCWLDIGQMGGGDKLFEKIDSGIRRARVVLSCVTDKYAKSPNCNREVNFAASINKPTIPLLLESCEWPPKGSMGPLFSQLLYIRFFKRAEERGERTLWPPEKFYELLMQLLCLGVEPQTERVRTKYQRWWEQTVVGEPKTTGLTVGPSRPRAISTKTTGSSVETSRPKVVSRKIAEQAAVAKTPDVFISYQWSSRKHALHLTDILTSRGLTCWTDVQQMGAGDSLFEKAETGLRTCQLVVACVSQKYAVATNCRREISLARTLEKRIIPVAVEEITWPLEGPLRDIMSKLSCFELWKDNLGQEQWNGPHLQKILTEIEKYTRRSDRGSKSLGSGTRDKETSKEGTAALSPVRARVRSARVKARLKEIMTPSEKRTNASASRASRKSPSRQAISKW
ncbi:uncharacterized protein LOC101858605 [Aplysia californica]|uniref:Uncharacterized protein LOC101858605 n=1 Tax=Aplysia californica TaxID=6500 RepID=A0ABM1AFV7_APLCA|nr:uncharacterized protein LOC101858605 [Aplysia californica]